MSIREVSELLKINEKTAYRLAAEGKLPGFKVGRIVAVRPTGDFELDQAPDGRTAGGQSKVIIYFHSHPKRVLGIQLCPQLRTSERDNGAP